MSHVRHPLHDLSTKLRKESTLWSMLNSALHMMSDHDSAAPKAPRRFISLRVSALDSRSASNDLCIQPQPGRNWYSFTRDWEKHRPGDRDDAVTAGGCPRGADLGLEIPYSIMLNAGGEVAIIGSHPDATVVNTVLDRGTLGNARGFVGPERYIPGQQWRGIHL
jgi:hypothetical protein